MAVLDRNYKLAENIYMELVGETCTCITVHCPLIDQEFMLLEMPV